MKIDKLMSSDFDKTKANTEQQILIKSEIKYFTFIEDELHPKNGHITFEINLVEQIISVAQYVYPTTLNYVGWVLNKNIQPTKTVLKNENCIYLSALNIINLLKRLNRGDAKNPHINFNEFTYVGSKHNAGSHLKIEIESNTKIIKNK